MLSNTTCQFMKEQNYLRVELVIECTAVFDHLGLVRKASQYDVVDLSEN